MGNVAAAAHCPAAETRDKLNKGIAGNKVLCLYREEKVKENVAIGEHHAESQQDPVNGAGSADGRIGVSYRRDQIDHCGADTADKIIDIKLPGTPVIFNFSTKHPQGEHIEEEMGAATVQKHVSYRLPYPEITGTDRPQGAKHGNCLAKWSHLQQKDCNIEQNNGLDRRGYKLKAPGTVWLGIIHYEVWFFD